MRRTHRLQARVAQRPQLPSRFWFVVLCLCAAFALSIRADAATGLCASGDCAVETTPDSIERSSVELSNDIADAAFANMDAIRRAALSDQEYFSFSGVGAIVCTVNGEQRMSTAFLVGAFDIGVTVAHTFVDHGRWTQPENCVYTTTDSIGQIRERIPVASIKTQWASESGAYGQLAKDFAVVRLTEPSRFAQRTMPLGKFSGHAASVLMIGFKSDMDGDTTKLKTRGTVYERKAGGLAVANLAGFMHDMDARGIAAGAPVIDERSGVIIGVHTSGMTGALNGRRARNTMIVMNDWLETTLKSELNTERAARAD